MDSGESFGGRLSRLDEQLLPKNVIEKEIDRLSGLGVEFVQSPGLLETDKLEHLLREYDAVYLGLDGSFAEDGLPEAVEKTVKAVRPLLQTTEKDGLFAGGFARPDGGRSPVWEAAEGRWAASSLDRWLKKVSLAAGREKEGPVETRLFTSIEGIEPLPAVVPANPERGYDEGEAVREAERCLQCECLECVKVCPYLERFDAYPRKYAREIYNNESIVMGSRQANKLINSCSLCGLCEAVCPEDFAMQDLCLQARRRMVQRGKMPPSAHEFALLDMAFSQSEHFALSRHEPGFDESAHVFFPGCQLCSSSPNQVRQVYDHLRRMLDGGVGLMLGCCCAPAHWAGREEQFRAEVKKTERQWEELGRPKLITACSTCYRTFRDHLPGIPVVSLWEVLNGGEFPETVTGSIETVYAVHDPCTTRPEPDIQEHVRKILDRLGAGTEELKLSRDKTECCGFGGLMMNANPGMAKEVVSRRAKQSELDYLAYCAMCRDNLAKTGKTDLASFGSSVSRSQGTGSGFKQTARVERSAGEPGKAERHTAQRAVARRGPDHGRAQESHIAHDP